MKKFPGLVQPSGYYPLLVFPGGYRQSPNNKATESQEEPSGLESTG